MQHGLDGRRREDREVAPHPPPEDIFVGHDRELVRVEVQPVGDLLVRHEVHVAHPGRVRLQRPQGVPQLARVPVPRRGRGLVGRRRRRGAGRVLLLNGPGLGVVVAPPRVLVVVLVAVVVLGHVVVGEAQAPSRVFVGLVAGLGRAPDRVAAVDPGVDDVDGAVHARPRAGVPAADVVRRGLMAAAQALAGEVALDRARAKASQQQEMRGQERADGADGVFHGSAHLLCRGRRRAQRFFGSRRCVVSCRR